MKKNLLVLLSLIFTIMIAVVGTTGCKLDKESTSESEKESTSISTSESTSEPESIAPAIPTVTLSDTTLDLDLYESATLTATLENVTGEIVWASSDDSVATVEDGVVTAYKGGTATVTATVGSVEASCTVNVSAEIGTFAFTELESTMNLMKGSSALLDFALTYNGDEFTMAEVSATTSGEVISYADGQITAIDYGTQTVNVIATVNGVEVYTYDIAVTVFEVGAVTFGGESIDLKLGKEGFAISNFKAIVNGVETTDVEFNVTFSEEGIALVEDGRICPVAEGEVNVTVAFTTSQATYDVIVPVKVSKETRKLDTIYAKGSLGEASAEIGDVVVDFTDKVALAEIIKVTCDGEEYTSFDVDGDVVTVISAPQGMHTFTLESANVRYFVDVCFYGHGVSTVEELEAWRTSNVLAYTVLLNDIDYKGADMQAVTTGYKGGILDGLGHTVYNFKSTTAFVHGIDVTGGIRNVQLVNFVQDCSSAGDGSVGFGIVTIDNMGIIENVLLKGQLVNVPNADHYGLIYKGAYNNGVCRNVFADLRSDGAGNHYVGPVWRESGENKDFVLENVVYVFNANTYAYDYTVLQVSVYATFDEFAANDVATVWGSNWKLENGQFCMSAYDESKFTVYSFGIPSVGGAIRFVASTFSDLTYEVVEGTDEMEVIDGVLAISENTIAGTEISVAVKDADGNVIKTFDYVVEINADVIARGKPIIGGTIEYTLNTNLPFENFTFTIVEGEDYATLEGTTLTFSEDAENGSVVRVEVTCSSDPDWIKTFEYVISEEEEVDDCVYEMGGFETTDEETAPEGFNVVSKYEGKGQNDAGEYIHGAYYSGVNLDKYISVSFGMKTPSFNFNSEKSYNDGEWMIFNLTQVSPDTWNLFVTVNGEIIYTKDGLRGSYDSSVNPSYSDNALDAILYGNPRGFNPKGVDGLITVYVTEVLGIVDPNYVEPEPPIVEPEPEEPIDPIGTIIQDCVYDTSVGYTTTDDFEPANGFVNVYKVVVLDADYIHGLNYCGINLDSYEVVTFAVKTAKFSLNGEMYDYSNEWLTFTLTQVADDTWDLVVTQRDATVYTKSGLRGAYDSASNSAYGDNALDAIIYGNPKGFAPWKHNDELVAYVSELRGVVKESTGEPEEPEVVETYVVLYDQVDGIGTVYNTITASFDVTRLGVDLSTVTGLTVDGANSEFTFDGATLTVTGLLAGDHVYELATADNTYKFIGCAYEVGITNAVELEAWRLDAGTTPRFAVLLNDIEYDGSLKSNGVYHYGSLDGRGYSIKNFTVGGGFFHRLWSDTSVFRNVKFVNATIDCADYEDVGFLGQWNKGVMENIYVDLTFINLSSSRGGVLVFGLNAPSDATNYTTTLRNVFVKFSGNSSYAVTLIRSVESNTQYMNLVGVGANVHEFTDSDSDVGYYANVQEMVNGEINDELTTFTSPYWYINSDKGTIDIRPYLDEENA